MIQKRATHIKHMYAMGEADFSSKEAIPMYEFGVGEEGYDLELRAQNIERKPLVETLKRIREILAPRLNSSKSSKSSELSEY